MSLTFTGKKRIRKSFGRIPEVVRMPDLIEVQKSSYELFLQKSVANEDRGDLGMNGVFRSVFPVRDFSDRAVLEYVSFVFDAPAFDEEECQQRDITYAAPLKVKMRLVVFDIDEDTGARSVKDIKEQDVYMGDIPLMTAKGTFIINGTERVIVSQMHRSPGVFFDHDKGKSHSSGKFLFSARIIPYRGSWLDFEFDAKDILFARIDRRRKLPATTILYALGMSKEDILNHYYEMITYKRDKKKGGWSLPFNASDYRGAKLPHDLIDAKTGEVVAPQGRKLTPRGAKKLADDGLKNLLISDEALAERYAGGDIVNTETGEIYAEAGDELSLEIVEAINEHGISEIEVLGIDHVNIGPYIRNTLAADKNESRDGALVDIYRIMRPGEPPTPETAEAPIKERMSSVDIETVMPHDLINAKPAAAVVREFFGSSQLSQFMDQTNPLSEITHKRRLSALGPGGLTRERAGFEVRDVHPTHYGRICPIETPEGPNIGLINSLATHARINKYGFIESPYRKVVKGKITKEVIYLSAMEEARYTIAQANAEVDDKSMLVGEFITCRVRGDVTLVERDDVNFIDVSPKQLVSVAAALIPFLENDDANRALMVRRDCDRETRRHCRASRRDAYCCPRHQGNRSVRFRR